MKYFLWDVISAAVMKNHWHEFLTFASFSSVQYDEPTIEGADCSLE